MEKQKKEEGNQEMSEEEIAKITGGWSISAEPNGSVHMSLDSFRELVQSVSTTPDPAAAYGMLKGMLGLSQLATSRKPMGPTG